MPTVSGILNMVAMEVERFCPMRPRPLACAVLFDASVNWSGDWAWGLPLVVATVLLHVLGLVWITGVVSKFSSRTVRQHPYPVFVVVVLLTTLFATVLHATEATIWAMAYRLLGALPDNKSSILYSLNAMTSYGHTSLSLSEHWHLMGAVEALNGSLLFGLSTAFLFAVIQRAGHRLQAES